MDPLWNDLETGKGVRYRIVLDFPDRPADVPVCLELEDHGATLYAFTGAPICSVPRDIAVLWGRRIIDGQEKKRAERAARRKAVDGQSAL